MKSSRWIDDIFGVKKPVIGMVHLRNFIGIIDGAIVGSEFKEDGKWQNPVFLERTCRFMEVVNALR